MKERTDGNVEYVDPKERRPLIVIEAVDNIIQSSLENQLGSQVPDTLEDQERIRRNELQAHFAATALNPENLAHARHQIENEYDLAQHNGANVIAAAEQIAREAAVQQQFDQDQSFSPAG